MMSVTPTQMVDDFLSSEPKLLGDVCNNRRGTFHLSELELRQVLHGIVRYRIFNIDQRLLRASMENRGRKYHFSEGQLKLLAFKFDKFQELYATFYVRRR